MNLDFIKQLTIAQIDAQIKVFTESKVEIINARNELEKYLISVDEQVAALEDLKKKYRPLGQAEGITFFHLGMEVSNMFLKVEQKAKIKIAIKDKNGNAAKVEGLPVWALTDPAAGTLTVDADGMGAEFAAGALVVPAFKVQVKCDADLSEGVKEILGELEIELLAGEAEVVELSAEVI